MDRQTDIICFSDLHIRDVGSFPPFNRIEENGLSRELNNCLKGVEFVRDQILEMKPSLVMSLGDWFHTPEGLPTSVIYAGGHLAFKMIKDACKEVNASFLMIAGNHDTLNESQNITLTSMFDSKYVIDEVEHISINDNEFVTIIPFTSDTEEFKRVVEDAKKRGSKALFTHQDFAGCRYETGHVSKSKLSPKIGIPVISGDIHLPQDIGDVRYCGSLVQNRFNRFDLSGVGGIIALNTKDMTITRKPNTYSKHYVKVVDLSKIAELDPKRVVLQIMCEADPQELDKLLDGKYEYIHINKSANGTMIPTDTSNGSIEVAVQKPEEMLRSYVSKENPDAIAMFDEVMNKETASNG